MHVCKCVYSICIMHACCVLPKGIYLQCTSFDLHKLFSLEHVTVSASLKTVLNVNGLSSVGLIITLNLKVNAIIYNTINRDYRLIN